MSEETERTIELKRMLKDKEDEIVKLEREIAHMKFKLAKFLYVPISHLNDLWGDMDE